MGTSKSVEILNKVFGHPSFRGRQEAIVDGALAGTNALVVMPTGMGKSLCYQLPAVAHDSWALVISPLVALMKDQVDTLVKRGVKARAIHAQMPQAERAQTIAGISRGELKLVYATPERLRKEDFAQAVRERPPWLLAVDEAHCISQWGTDFRPDYSRLGEWREAHGKPVTLALTATATPRVREDILTELRLESATPVYIEGVERPNLHLAVEDVHGLDDKIRRFVALRHQYPGPAIVYFSLISSLEKFANQIRRLNLQFKTYHGQLDERARRQNQEEFLKGRADLMLATPAFGLGIDKADIRLIVHGEIPGSIEAYYQEVGRAGRDGKPAHAALLYDEDDVSIQIDFIKWANPDAGFIGTVARKLKTDLAKFQAGGLDVLRREMNFFNSRDFRLETALNLLERWDCISWPHKDMKLLEWKVEPPAEFLDGKMHEAKLKNQQNHLLELVRWATTEGCRKRLIYEYFGSAVNEDCGFCQNCDKAKA